MKKNINYSVDYYGTLRIFDGNEIIAEISNCENMSDTEINNLIEEILEEL